MKLIRENQKDGFVHSQPVPRIFKTAAKITKKVKEGVDSLKNLVYNETHVNIQTVYGIILKTLQKFNTIEELITKSELLVKEPRFDSWLARILICELLFGRSKLEGNSKPIQIILKYQKIFEGLLESCTNVTETVVNFNVSKPRYVRVNTLKLAVNEAVNNFREEGWMLAPFFEKTDYSRFLEKLNNLKPSEFMVDPHVPDLLIFPPKTEFYNHPAYKFRNILLQDKASCLPVQLLNPTPNSIVLDMCAAPGMKTTQLASLLKNSGTVYAVELDENREKLLRQVVESTGATCVKTILKDVMQVNNDDCPNVEYILVDPSCSGSGITDRIEVERVNTTDRIERLNKLSSFQAKLLRHALKSFPKAKRVVYSTCSINSEENEDVVRQVLETCSTFKLINAKKLLPSWNNSSSEVFPVLGEMCIYSNPENDKTNGFFIAVFERLQEGEKNPFLNVELFKMFKKRAEQSAAKKLEIQESDQNVSFEKRNEQGKERGGSKKKVKDEELKRGVKLEDEEMEFQNVPEKKKKRKNKSEIEKNENCKIEEDEMKKGVKLEDEEMELYQVVSQRNKKRKKQANNSEIEEKKVKIEKCEVKEEMNKSLEDMELDQDVPQKKKKQKNYSETGENVVKIENCEADDEMGKETKKGVALEGDEVEMNRSKRKRKNNSVIEENEKDEIVKKFENEFLNDEAKRKKKKRKNQKNNSDFGENIVKVENCEAEDKIVKETRRDVELKDQEVEINQSISPNKKKRKSNSTIEGNKKDEIDEKFENESLNDRAESKKKKRENDLKEVKNEEEPESKGHSKEKKHKKKEETIDSETHKKEVSNKLKDKEISQEEKKTNDSECCDKLENENEERKLSKSKKKTKKKKIISNEDITKENDENNCEQLREKTIKKSKKMEESEEVLSQHQNEKAENVLKEKERRKRKKHKKYEDEETACTIPEENYETNQKSEKKKKHKKSLENR